MTFNLKTKNGKLKTLSARKTFLLARKMAKELLRSRVSTPFVIGLFGDLGSGKTTFVKGFAAGLGIKEIVVSPTFLLICRYPFASGTLYHIDPYRLKDPLGALRSLGFYDMLKEKGAIIIIEWAKRLKPLLPRDTVWIAMRHVGGNKREIRM